MNGNIIEFHFSVAKTPTLVNCFCSSTDVIGTEAQLDIPVDSTFEPQVFVCTVNNVQGVRSQNYLVKKNGK